MGNFIRLLIVVALLSLGQVASAGPLEDGSAAYARGDYATAMKLWRPLAEQGDAAVQFTLGDMYANGRGVAQDHKEAVKWYRLAAQQGDESAQFYLGRMYYNGRGVPQDHKEAAKWFRFSAEQRYADAQYSLGFMYYNGQGVPQDHKEAVKWYRLSAEQGLAHAQYGLGWMYEGGRGVAQDHKEAVKWYRLAAQQGVAEAQYNLGFRYTNGRGVAQDCAFRRLRPPIPTDRDHLFRSIATGVVRALVAPLDVDCDVSLPWVGQARQGAVPVVNRRDPRATRSALTADAAARVGGPC